MHVSVAMGQAWSALTIAPDGRPVAVGNGDPSGLRVGICHDPRCDDPPFTRIHSPFPHSSAGAIQVSLTTFPDGRPLMAYRNEYTANLALLLCEDIYCTTWVERILDTPANDGYYSSVAIGADGFPVVSYTDAGSADLRVYHCNDLDCTGGGDVSSVVHQGGFGYYTSLAIGRDGNPVISYWRGGVDGLGVARCNDPACTGGDEMLSIVDPGSGVGRYSSLAIGHDGNPVISYQDSGPGDLKIAHCNDPACAGQNEDVMTLDSVGTVGAFSSLAVGLDGVPVVSYADETNNDVKVIRALGAAS
jgi:hypothetical protein